MIASHNQNLPRQLGRIRVFCQLPAQSPRILRRRVGHIQGRLTILDFHVPQGTPVFNIAYVRQGSADGSPADNLPKIRRQTDMLIRFKFCGPPGTCRLLQPDQTALPLSHPGQLVLYPLYLCCICCIIHNVPLFCPIIVRCHPGCPGRTFLSFPVSFCKV